MQLIEQLTVKASLIFIFQVCPTPNLHVECQIYLITFSSRETFFVITGNESTEQDKKIKSTPKNNYYQKS